MDDAAAREILRLAAAGAAREALQAVARASGVAPESAAACHLLGLLLAADGDAAAALAWFDHALRRDPDLAVCHNDRGAVLYRLGRYWSAALAFGNAVRLAPALSNAQDNLKLAQQALAAAGAALADAERCGAEGRREEAIQSALRTVAEVPDHRDGLDLLANLLFENGNGPQAQEIVERALEFYPDDARLLQSLDRVTAVPAQPVMIAAWLRSPRPAPIESRPLVSVTVCTYNHVRFIDDCVRSVLAQTYSPLEIVIGDDASTDDTAAIVAACLDGYAGPHCVEFIRHPNNLGYAGGGNYCDSYRRTRGEFVIQFSGDDTMHPRMVETMVDRWLASGASMVVVNAEYMDGDSRTTGATRIAPAAEPNAALESLVRDGVNDCVFGAGSGYDRRFFDAFPQCLGNPPRHLGTQDILFPFLAGLMSGCAMIAEPLMRYRVHGAQNSLSVAVAGADDERRKLVLEEKMWLAHLGHALFMREVLERAITVDVGRYRPLQERLAPLLAHQTFLMSSRLIAVRKRLFYEFGVNEIAQAMTPAAEAVRT